MRGSATGSWALASHTGSLTEAGEDHKTSKIAKTSKKRADPARPEVCNGSNVDTGAGRAGETLPHISVPGFSPCQV